MGKGNYASNIRKIGKSCKSSLTKPNMEGIKDKRQEVGCLPSGKTTIFRKFRKNRKNGHFLQSLTLKMVGLLQLKLPTSTLVGFLINGLIMNILQHIFPQAENLVFQFQKSRGRIFCVFPRLLLLQSKSLRPLLAGEFVGRSSETQREMRKQRILSGTANGPIPPQNQPQKRKNRPEVRSAENRKNGRPISVLSNFSAENLICGKGNFGRKQARRSKFCYCGII